MNRFAGAVACRVRRRHAATRTAVEWAAEHADTVTYCTRCRAVTSRAALPGSVVVEGVRLTRVHPDSECLAGPCVIHRPSGHHMRAWPLHWRDDRGLFERVCPHGIGHPDPDQYAHWQRAGRTGMGVHCCDSCCVPARAVS